MTLKKGMKRKTHMKKHYPEKTLKFRAQQAQDNSFLYVYKCNEKLGWHLAATRTNKGRTTTATSILVIECCKKIKMSQGNGIKSINQTSNRHYGI